MESVLATYHYSASWCISMQTAYKLLHLSAKRKHGSWSSNANAAMIYIQDSSQQHTANITVLLSDSKTVHWYNATSFLSLLNADNAM